MKKITICDDNIEDLKSLERLLISYNVVGNRELYEWDVFSDSNKLSSVIDREKLSDIYILDLMMPLKDGIDIGRQIRERNTQPVIIYTTSSSDFALEAYGVQASRYLLKPVQEGAFFEAMDYAVTYLNGKADEPSYLVKTRDGIISLHYSQIEYIENKSRIMYVHLSDRRVIKSLYIRTSFEGENEDLIKNEMFAQVHKSFLVNLKYVETLRSDCMVMTSGACIPVSKNKYTEVKRQYLMFTVDQYR